MKKKLMIVLGIIIAVVIIGFGVVKFYVEPNLNFIVNDFFSNEHTEDNSQVVNLDMEDLLNDLDKDIEKTVEKYEDKELIVTADLNNADEIGNYQYIGVKSELETNLIDFAYFNTPDENYRVDVYFIEQNDDFLRINEKTLTNKKIKEKYDIDKLKEKGTITFECWGLEYNEEFGEISLYVTKYPAK